MVAENDGAFLFDSLFAVDQPNSPSLRTLNLSGIKLGDMGTKRVFEALVATPYPNLEHFRLDSNEITGTGPSGSAMASFLQASVR